MKRFRAMRLVYPLGGVSLLAVLLCLSGVPAQANDSTALLGAGGLELTTSPDIVMAKEDLFLSSKAVRVQYEFRNEGKSDITTRVAFPLPLVEQGAATNVDLPAREHENFVDFRVVVDGKDIHPQLEQRAIMADGRDVTDILAAAGIPPNSFLPGWDEKLKALPQNVWMKLVRDGLFEVDEKEAESRPEYISPAWKLKATFHWEQTFPAGKVLRVHHSYMPIVGSSFVAESYDRSEDFKPYCLDADGNAGLRRKMRELKAKAKDHPDMSPLLVMREVDYVLTTGANWKGPIEDFHLTIDKEDPKAILSLCMEGLKKTGPTTFELERKNFAPKDDIRFATFGD